MIGLGLFGALAFLCLAGSRFTAFVLFTAGTILFSRGFSHINVGLYVTEYFMLLILLSFLLVILYRGKITVIRLPYERTLGVLYLIMIMDIVRGMLMYPDKSFVIRQSALFYYSLFYFMVPHIFTSMRKIEKYFTVFFVMAIIAALTVIFGVQWHAIGKFGYYYESLSLVLAGIIIVNQKRILTLNARQWGAVILFFGVVLSSVRAAWMGIFAVLMFLFISAHYDKYLKRVARKLITYGSVIALSGLLGIGIFKFDMFEALSGKVMSILPGSRSVSVASNNTKWRLIVWKDMLREAAEKPLLGWGFGRKFIPPTIKKMGWGGSWRKAEGGFQDPHNSFISVFYRTGFIGVLVFCALLGSFIVRTLWLIRRMSDPLIRSYMTGLLLCMVCILGMSCFMVVLEGPFLGIFLWIAMGLIVSLERIERKRALNAQVPA